MRAAAQALAFIAVAGGSPGGTFVGHRALRGGDERCNRRATAAGARWQSKAYRVHLVHRAAAKEAAEHGRRLEVNLVDNAVLHNVPGGSLRVRTGCSHGSATVSVANTGPVIPAAAVGELFEPFRRLSAERTVGRDGLGLGLSIVDAIVTAHGGLRRARALPGGGLEIEVRFPEAKKGHRR